MENPVSQLVQDQNLNIHSAGGSSLGRKIDILPRAAKKGGAVGGGRKALNDISNSGKPSALQASKKHNSSNVITVAKDVVGGSKSTLSVGGKANLTKVPEKGKGGRKALSDLTNSAKPSPHHLSKKDQEKKLNVTAADKRIPSSIKEEGFLHNHQECITAQRKDMNFDYFLESVGLGRGSPLVLLQPLELKKPESPIKNHLEMVQEIAIPVSPQNKKAHFPEYSSLLPPYDESPKSIKCSAYEFWKDDGNLSDLKLIDSPPPPSSKLQKHLI